MPLIHAIAGLSSFYTLRLVLPSLSITCELNAILLLFSWKYKWCSDSVNIVHRNPPLCWSQNVDLVHSLQCILLCTSEVKTAWKDCSQSDSNDIIQSASTNLLIVLHWFLWGSLYTIQQFVQHKLYKPVDSVRPRLMCRIAVCCDCVSFFNKRYVHSNISPHYNGTVVKFCSVAVKAFPVLLRYHG